MSWQWSLRRHCFVSLYICMCVVCWYVCWVCIDVVSMCVLGCMISIRLKSCWKIKGSLQKGVGNAALEDIVAVSLWICMCCVLVCVLVLSQCVGMCDSCQTVSWQSNLGRHCCCQLVSFYICWVCSGVVWVCVLGCMNFIRRKFSEWLCWGQLANKQDVAIELWRALLLLVCVFVCVLSV